MYRFTLLSLFSAVLVLTACGGGGGSSAVAPAPNISYTDADPKISYTDADINISYTDAIVTDSYFFPKVPRTTVYSPALASSPYAAVLESCTNPNYVTTYSPCTLSVLPLIGTSTTTPTKTDILNRTLVSHAWMATRFSQVLDRMPADILQMFRGTTAIVITADIDRAFYWPSSGAIYIPAQDLWMTSAEFATLGVSVAGLVDQGYGLAFRDRWDYVDSSKQSVYMNGQYYNTSGRSATDVDRYMASVLVHELAHANDFMPPTVWATVDSSLTVDQQIDLNAANGVYVAMNRQRSRLQSGMLTGLADVLFNDGTASTSQKLITASTVGAEFDRDAANDLYNYSDPHEDTAMLIEETMMKHHFDLHRAVAFTNPPSGTGSACDEYQVVWGKFDRVADAQVKPRAGIVVKQLLGVSDSDPYLSKFTSSRNMMAGTGFCTALAN